ncbi:MAG: shikimate dehydrogenase [Peptococcaceae bacterium]|nr:shikimate dehydrogenase [Peptococcaceae bacterium]
MVNWINGKTRLCGIFGNPVRHSFSPAMHNAAFAALGLNYVYLPFSVEVHQLTAAVAGIRAMGLVGLNVTIPHKQSIMPLLDDLSAEARLMGAVNTVVNQDGYLFGDNTDGTGFLSALQAETGFFPAGKTALIIGAGGAARAVSVKLALSGAKELYIMNRSGKGAEDLADLLYTHTKAHIQVIPWLDNGQELSVKADLTVQTTPVGMLSETGETDRLPRFHWVPGQVVCDLIYNPGETRFMVSAREKGATVINGLGMLLYQGALAFQMWTGLPAPLEVMGQSLIKSMKSVRQEAG